MSFPNLIQFGLLNWDLAAHCVSLITIGKNYYIINNSAADCPIVLQFDWCTMRLWRSGKSTCGQIQDVGRRPNFQCLNRYNSAANCAISLNSVPSLSAVNCTNALKSDTWVHNGVAIKVRNDWRDIRWPWSCNESQLPLCLVIIYHRKLTIQHKTNVYRCSSHGRSVYPSVRRVPVFCLDEWRYMKVTA